MVSGGSVKKVSTLVEKLAKDGTFLQYGFSFKEKGTALHEVEVNGEEGTASGFKKLGFRT